MQGAILVSSVMHTLIGATGLVGLLVRFLSPLILAAIIVLIGFALMPVAVEYASSSWPLALLYDCRVAHWSPICAQSTFYSTRIGRILVHISPGF